MYKEELDVLIEKAIELLNEKEQIKEELKLYKVAECFINIDDLHLKIKITKEKEINYDIRYN